MPEPTVSDLQQARVLARRAHDCLDLALMLSPSQTARLVADARNSLRAALALLEPEGAKKEGD